MPDTMPNRIDSTFAQLRQRGHKGLVAYITAGDPDLETTGCLAQAIEKAGADILELGVPFSDPLADGPVNQLAAQRALQSGTTLRKIIRLVRDIRASCQIPIALFTYYNPVHRYGLAALVEDAAAAGVDGLLILDLPPEEAEGASKIMALRGISRICLVAPTSSEERIKKICAQARGFIYYVSREGVTGMQQSVANSLSEKIALIRKYTDLPIAVGFGISNPEQAAQVAAMADAVVVGSAIVDQIAKLGRSANLLPDVASFVQSLADAVKSRPPAPTP